MTDEQARWLEAIYRGMIVPGTVSPDQTMDLLFARVRQIEADVEAIKAAVIPPPA